MGLGGRERSISFKKTSTHARGVDWGEDEKELGYEKTNRKKFSDKLQKKGRVSRARSPSPGKTLPQLSRSCREGVKMNRQGVRGSIKKDLKKLKRRGT